MADNIGTLQSRLGRKSANLQNRPTPFKESFRQLGGGGKAQATAIGQKQERLKKVGDIAKQKTIARGQEAKRQITGQSAQFNQQLQDKQDELQTARRFALEDVNTFVQQKMRERQKMLEVLQIRREKLKKQLQGFVDDDTMEREMEGINQLIEGGSSLFFEAGLPRIQQARTRRFQERFGEELRKRRTEFGLTAGLRKRFGSPAQRIDPRDPFSFKGLDFEPETNIKDFSQPLRINPALQRTLGSRTSPFQSLIRR